MVNIIKARDLKMLEARLPSLPWFVELFVQHKLAHLSPSTLLEYTRDFETFFRWLLQEGLSHSPSIFGIPLSDLEALTSADIDSFKLHLQLRSGNSLPTRERKMASLKSLFHYLSQIAEDEQRYPLLKRNVMAKLRTQRLSSAAMTAARLQGKILEDESEIQAFCSFIDRDYVEQIVDNPQALHYYQLNKTRDTCIVTLILSSGLRVSEVVNLNLDDLDLTRKIAYVYRKGSDDPDVKQGVYFSEIGKDALFRYLQRREALYSPARSEKAVFLSIPRGETQGRRISKRAIQQMVGKYAKAFGKPLLSVHKLRHSFATNYYEKNDIYKTQRQLGHASTETTQLYAQLTDKTMENAINRL